MRVLTFLQGAQPRSPQLPKTARVEEAQATEKLGSKAWRESFCLSRFVHDVRDLSDQTVSWPKPNGKPLVAIAHIMYQPQKVGLALHCLMLLRLEGRSKFCS